MYVWIYILYIYICYLYVCIIYKCMYGYIYIYYIYIYIYIYLPNTICGILLNKGVYKGNFGKQGKLSLLICHW